MGRLSPFREGFWFLSVISNGAYTQIEESATQAPKSMLRLDLIKHFRALSRGRISGRGAPEAASAK